MLMKRVILRISEINSSKGVFLVRNEHHGSALGMRTREMKRKRSLNMNMRMRLHPLRNRTSWPLAKQSKRGPKPNDHP